MRRILIDHARHKRTDKKGGQWDRAPLEEAAVFFEETDTDPQDLDQALNRLDDVDPQAVQVVELRFFAGLPVEETAKVLGVSTATVKRDWRMARAWLKRDMER
jgi:RNA polymerase sigma factor (TIGR02999 family)